MIKSLFRLSSVEDKDILIFQLTIKSSDGLYLLVDSIGLKFLGEGEGKRKKHQPEYRRQWRKLHVGIDAKTQQIRAVQLAINNVSDSQVLGDLVDQIPLDEHFFQFIQSGLMTQKDAV